MLSFAFGEMGLTPHEYYCMSPLEFYYASTGYNKKVLKQWEHTRHISYTVAGTVPSKKRLPPITRWMPLPTDRGNGISPSRAKAIFENLKKQTDAKRTGSYNNC